MRKGALPAAAFSLIARGISALDASQGREFALALDGVDARVALAKSASRTRAVETEHHPMKPEHLPHY
ncbi:MAG: hypothetical protein AAGA15_04185, partial [Pseudomonadota bacterium]